MITFITELKELMKTFLDMTNLKNIASQPLSLRPHFRYHWPEMCFAIFGTWHMRLMRVFFERRSILFWQRATESHLRIRRRLSMKMSRALRVSKC